MAVTYVYNQTSGGAGTSTDQLAGTPVYKAGPKGLVRAAVSSTLTTTDFLLKGRLSGREVIPNGSAANIIGPITAQELRTDAFIFEAFVTPGEELELTIVRIGTETLMVAIRTE